MRLDPFAFWRRIPWRAIRARAVVFVWALAFLALVPNSAPAGGSLEERALGIVRDDLFNYAAWTLDAMLGKIGTLHGGLAPFMDEDARAAFVVDYTSRVARLGELNRQIETSQRDPSLDRAALITARDAVQAEVSQREAAATAIIEGHLAAVLRDEGLATLGAVIPPVSAEITELPLLLVISPRETIRRDLAINLVNLPPDRIEAVEALTDARLNVSSLIVPLGGLSLYPSMIIETWHIPTLYEVVAHEWAHHYLYFFPLGLEYLNAGGETWIINETTASLFGKEIGRRAIERFYQGQPDVLRLLPREATPRPAGPAPTPDPNAFDIGAALNETRVTADRLLAEGQVAAAEQYMAERRDFLAANGYNYRKINQAFFAFYGGYQSPGGGGAGGEDPIGPAVNAIRQASPSIRTWLETMRSITSRAALLETRDRLSR